MYLTIFTIKLGDNNCVAGLSDVCFDISVIDKTFKYKVYNNKGTVVVSVMSEDKDTAYKRGELLRRYVKDRVKCDVYYKVKEE